jgi:hypothetical protein
MKIARVGIGCAATPSAPKRSTQTERRHAMGDKGGKKDKDKDQKQKATKDKQKAEQKQEKQPKKTP